jgi:tetratricopeptide (TPR) repeat protein
VAEHPSDAASRKPLAQSANNLAWFLATTPHDEFRDAQRAVELAQRAVELDPKALGHWNTLGVAQFRVGDWQAALESLTKSLDARGGGDSFDWFFLAMVHHRLDHPADARRWYDQAVAWMQAHDPDNDLKRFRAEAVELLGLPSTPQP